MAKPGMQLISSALVPLSKILFFLGIGKISVQLLGPEYLITISSYQTLLQLLLIVSSLGLNIYLIQLLSATQDTYYKLIELLYSAALLVCSSSLLVWICFASNASLFAHKLGLWNTQLLTPLLKIIVLPCLLICSIGQVEQARMSSHGEYQKIGILNLSGLLLGLATFYCACSILPKDKSAVVLVVATALTSLPLCISFINQNLVIRPPQVQQFNLIVFIKLLKYSCTNIICLPIAPLSIMLTRSILLQHISINYVNEWEAASRLALGIDSAISIFFSYSLIPSMSQLRKSKNLSAFIYKHLLFCLTLVAPLLILVAALGDRLIPILYDSSLSDSSNILRIYMLAIFLRCIFWPVSAFPAVFGLKRLMASSELILTALYLGLVNYFINVYSSYTPPVMMSTISLIGFIAMLPLFKSYLKKTESSLHQY